MCIQFYIGVLLFKKMEVRMAIFLTWFFSMNNLLFMLVSIGVFCFFVDFRSFPDKDAVKRLTKKLFFNIISLPFCPGFKFAVQAIYISNTKNV